MRSRPTFWILLGLLLCAAGAWFFWPHAGNRLAERNSTAQKNSIAKSFATPAATVTSAATAPNFFTSTNAATAQTNEFAYRLSNTAKSIGDLAREPRAVLLENALIDTRLPLNFSIPKNLQSAGDPGSYIVQAKRPIDAAFRAALARAGAEIISYIPNNAYLVRISAVGAGALSANAQTASVIPYEPYYKISSSVPVGTRQTTAASAPARNSSRLPTLLELAVKQKPLPPGTILTLGIFNGGAAATFSQIEKLGGSILTTNRSPFGLMLRVAPPENWTALALLPGVQIVEPYHPRVRANDLSRVTTGVAVNTVTNANYLNLSGSNVLVAMNDSGVDATHPDLVGRVFGLLTNDTAGHGTFVAGEIAGNGTKSSTVTNASGSVTNANFRGKAPLAKLFVMDFNDADQDLQQGAALTNALISNNSWNFDGDTAYDLAAASYDAATRDALPGTTGSQPVLFVFSAGNSGGGDNSGGGGGADTILSPATAKDVISVGALESLRNITNKVVMNGVTNAIWQPQTDTSYQVANYSSRGNVGVGTEGTAGRFKPDVVAPGTFIISTRSQQWDQKSYFNPTNGHTTTITDVVEPDSLTDLPLQFFVYKNAVGVTIRANAVDTSVPLPIYVWPGTNPNITDPILEGTNSVTLPATPRNVNWYCAVSNTTGAEVTYNLTATVLTTNDLGNELTVLSNLDNSIGTSPYYYRYESGTSMAAPDVSGMLALVQDFFTNTLHATPSPALLKAFVINGARSTSTYNFHPQNPINWEGWGLINLPNSVPAGSTNLSGTNSVFYLDQSPTNALATGDSHTFVIAVPTNSPTLRVTLAWTDPAGNPVAAIKLVNNLDLVVTTTNSTATNIYYGNDIPAVSVYNSAGSTNAPNLDTVNNIENVFLQSPSAGNYYVTVIGRGVNVNAVTAQTNNVVQDYALVISSGDGLAPGAVTVTRQANISNPTSDQLITDVVSTNAPLFNQYAGANSPLLGTNTIVAGGNTTYVSNAIVTVGMTNQWHFYVVTNTTGFTNAAFITFLPPTLSIPRIGVFAGSDANSTTPEADIDMYVATEASLTNLDPTVLSNCVHGVNGDGASLSRGGTEFVTYTNSTANQIYYVGVKSETQMASEYAFLPVFTQTPFSQLDGNNNEIVNGIPLPVAIPDGSPAHPGAGYVFGLALQPMQIENVIVSNQITHQNIGDLIGVLTHDTESDVLNNHNSLGNPPGPYNFIYDDSQFPVAGSQPSDGPGSLLNFVGQEAAGAWVLAEVDNSPGQTGSVTGFSLLIQPHHDPSKGVNVSLAPGEFFTTFVDVPLAATNLSIFATNLTGTISPPVELFVRYNTPPTQTNFDAMTLLNSTPNPPPPGGSISIGATNQPPLRPGRYFIGLFNPGLSTNNIFLITTLGISASGPTILDFASAGPVPLADDAVTTSSISLTNTDPIASVNVGIRVDHPRISDLVFHLISPDGSRYLLMENRGGTTTNGAGASYLTTNTTTVPHNGDNQAFTNTINTGTTNGTITISYDFFTLPDTMEIFDGATLLTNTGLINGSGTFSINYSGSPLVQIIMNPGGNTNFPGTAWTYAVTSTTAKYVYLAFTEDTNLTTTPIKFAPPPFVPVAATNTTIQTNITFSTNATTVSLSSFDSVSAGDYSTASTVDNWNVVSNQVSVVNDPANAQSGSQFLALANGSISRTLPTFVGQTNTLTYTYRGPGVVSLWQGQGTANDSVSSNNGTLLNGTTFTGGEVGQAFSFTGGAVGTASRCVQIPLVPSLIVPNFSVDAWINPASQVTNSEGQTWIFGQDRGLQMNLKPGTTGVKVDFNFRDGGSVFHPMNSIGQIPTNQFSHVAATWDGTTSRLYINGVLDNSATPGATPASSGCEFFIGGTYHTAADACQTVGQYFNGIIDETSFYGRALSDSEILAIYNLKSAGKYDASAFPTNLAKAKVTLSGVANAVVFGANTNWQTNTVTFVASTNGTTLQISGLEPGMLLDTFTLTGFGAITNYVTNTVVMVSNLYYFPEQSIAPLIGTSPNGTWQMEVQDDRVGAYDSNSPPSLLSWQLEFVLASTNSLKPPVFTNTPPESIIMDELTTRFVTNNAVAASTNLTLTYSLTNSPVWATINPSNGIITLKPLEADGPTNVIITTIVTDNGLPPLSSQNSFSVTVNEVNSAPFWPTNVPSQTNYVINALSTLTVVNTAIDTDSPPNTLTFRLVNPPTPAGVLIDTNTGIITWTPTLAQTSSIPYTIETIVTDTNIYALTNQSLSATNSFTVTVLPPSSPTSGVPQTNIVAPGGITWFLINVPTNADFATNILLFATAPVNIWFSTNSPPTVTNFPGDVDLIPNATNGLSILSTNSSPTNIVPGGSYFLGVQNTNSFPVTNAIEVDFHFTSFVTGPPVFATTPGTNTIYELTLLTVTNKAADVDSGTTLGYTLSIVIDTNAMVASNWPTTFANTTNTTPVISPGGIITWTPSEFQGPGVYDITTTVTNTEIPSLSATNTFTVIVNESNAPPAFLFPTNTTLTNIVEGFPLTNLQAVATDSDIPTNTLTFAFVGGTNPIGQAITNLNVTTNGLISWAPTGTNFLGTNLVSVSVTDTNIYAPTNKSLSVTNTFKIVVWEVNTAPFFTNNPPTNTIAVLTTLVVTNTATDTDSPPNTLTYTLLNPPTNAVINPATGVITWTPPVAYANTTNTIFTIVTDTNVFALTNKSLSATNSFVVIVLVPPYSATLAATAVTGTTAQLNGMATPNGSPAFAWFQWGINNGYGTQTPPVSVGSGKSVVYVTNALGGLTLPQAYHYRLVTSNTVAVTYGFDQIFDVGGVVAWGNDDLGQTNVPPILTNNIAVAIAGGSSNSLALMNNGRPIAWGDDSFAQTNVPVTVTNAVAIAAGGNFNLALRSNGRVVGWGYNVDGETTAPANLSNVVAIAAGFFHSMALRTNGTVVAWGYDGFFATNVPASLSNVVAIAGGVSHSVALKNDGTVVAWGTGAGTNVPAGLNNVVAVAAGNSYSLALKTNGTVVAWGVSSVQTNVPAGLSNVVAIAAGGFHCLALKSDGTVVAWGDDSSGQTNVPAGLTNVAAVAAGSFHSLALVAATPVNLVNTAPFFVTNPPNQSINVAVTLTVTNTATDSDLPAQTLTYTLLNPPANAGIATSGTNAIITFTPSAAQANTTNAITTIVTDNGAPNLSATNSFSVIVYPIPVISSVSFATNALTLHWFAPTNDQFKVQWTTNLAAPIVWTFLPNNASPAIITSTTGAFFFTDTNALFMTEFYRLVLLP